MAADRDRTSVSTAEAEVEAMIDELAGASARLADLQRDSVAMLKRLLEERSRIRDSASTDPPPAEQGAIAGGVLENATLFAHAAGVSVKEFLREAVLAHGARLTADGRDGDRATRARAAREEALRLRSESLAVKAQNTQARARTARAARPKDTERSHGPPGDGASGASRRDPD